jgi:hypothetical protein
MLGLFSRDTALAKTSLKNQQAGLLQIPIWLFIVNALSFQGLWFIAVAKGDAISLLLVAPVIFLHFFLMDRVYRKRFCWLNELKLIFICVCIGFVVEVLKLRMNVWSPSVTDSFPPLWLMSLWVGLAISLHISLSYFQSKLFLSAFIGAFFAPLSYFAGSQLSPSFKLADLAYSLPIIAAIWFVIFPLLLLIAKRLPATMPRILAL